MANILGVQLPKEKRVIIGLTKIYGVGRTTADSICNQLVISKDTRINDLSKRQISRITNLIKQELLVGSDLRKQKSDAIKRLMEMGSYKGVRHRMGLPLRGQRTSTNGKTQKRLASKHRRG
jgi:small subunit ribosomal protein S13